MLSFLVFEWSASKFDYELSTHFLVGKEATMKQNTVIMLSGNGVAREQRLEKMGSILNHAQLSMVFTKGLNDKTGKKWLEIEFDNLQRKAGHSHYGMWGSQELRRCNYLIRDYREKSAA